MPLHDGGGGFRIQVVSALDFFFMYDLNLS